MNLVTEVSQDIANYLNSNNQLLFNERDFQMHLATYLRNTSKYDDVDLEYYVPHQALSNYIWESELRLDILVRKGNEYLPVELKYKTKKVNKDILRFGENLSDIIVLKNQGAQDWGKYDFWKDVRRVELVRQRFRNIKNGLAVFVTNDDSYTKPSREKSNSYLLNMDEGMHSIKKYWADSKSACAQNHPNFNVEKEYHIHWNNIIVEDIPFVYCIVEI